MAELHRRLGEVAGRLLDFCATDCVDPWACNTCPIWEARRDLERIGIGVYLPETMVTLEPEEEQALAEARQVLTVIRGGRQ